MIKNIKLNNGIEMPEMGFGTFLITDKKECEESVINAIQTGYRLIDTAQAYGNEDAVGFGIKNSGIKREDLFLTTKAWFKSYETDACKRSIEESLKKLQTDYLDLVLLHWPFGNTYAAYRVLEDFYKQGVIKAIGVSNYMPSQLVDLINFNEVVPAVNQIEVNLLCQQKELTQVNKKYNVVTQAYAPFGQGKADYMYEIKEVVEIAKNHNKTPRQIALRFLLQNGIAVIPKSTHKNRMEENIDVFNFELSNPEMEKLSKIDTGKNLIGCSQDFAIAEFAMTW